MQAATFFNPAQNAAIAAAIAEVETSTSGEVAVMVVDQSDTYPESLVLAGILLGGLSATVVADLWFADSLWTFLPMATGFSLLIGWGVGQWPALKRFFITRARLEHMVREQAVQSFYEKGLYKTRDATGVLFFISLFEHRVWILADQGIYEKISRQTLQEHAVAIAHGIKHGAAASALCRAIGRVGEILSQHFPVRPDDTDELSNEVLLP